MNSLYPRYCLLILVTLFLSQPASTQSQEASIRVKNLFYFDFIMGPYLFVDHIPYDAVMMTGGRLGYEITKRVNCSVEYVVGQQQDDQNTLGFNT